MASPTALTLTINGASHVIDTETIAPSTTLNDYLRQRLRSGQASATKVSCNEGGCGACTVALTSVNAATGATTTRAINSCLAPILSLNGMSVQTNDGIGTLDAPHPIQQKLADDSGTQCGYCSSGMVMALYGFLAEKPNATAAEIEAMLDGNLCRCTGYRPILDAFKSFGAETKACLPGDCPAMPSFDIEESGKRRCHQHQHQHQPSGAASRPLGLLTFKVPSPLGTGGHQQWVDVTTLDQLTYWLTHWAGKKVMLVVGATTQALTRVAYDAYINVKPIAAFNTITQNNTAGITIGAAVTIADVIAYLECCVAPTSYGGNHLPQLRRHLGRVASTLIRNRASLVGNLVYTHQHQTAGDAFPSDAAIALMGVGAQVTLHNVATKASTTVGMRDFFTTSGVDGSTYVVTSVTIPWLGSATTTFSSYKIAVRQTLDHAIVNAAMQCAVDPTTGIVAASPIIIAVGGLFPVPTRLTSVESAMAGVQITSATAVATLCTAFTAALNVTGIDPAPGRLAYRKHVALSYFYKFVLALQPTTLPSTLSLAAQPWMTRAVSSGSQTFGTKPSEYPVSEPIPKIDGLAQTTGRAQFTADIPTPYGCLFGALVVTQRANVPITSVNRTAAAAVDGFVAYVDGTTPAFTNSWYMFGVTMGELFATAHSQYAGQVAGCVFATSLSAARDGAELVQASIQYGAPAGPVVVDVASAVKQGVVLAGSAAQVVSGDTSKVTPDVVVSGTLAIKPQYHFHLENHAVLVQNVEGQLVVELASQAPSCTQVAVAGVTGLPSSSIVVKTRRCGGGYGGKAIYPAQIACIASVASLALNRPARIDCDFKDAMRSFGCRPDYQVGYTMGLASDGTIMSLTADVAAAGGWQASEASEVGVLLSNLDNCYNVHNASWSGAMYQSNVPGGAPVRGPGWIQSIALSEMMMNAAARQLKMDPVALRVKNLYKDGDVTPNGTYIRGVEISKLWNQMLPTYTQLKADAVTFNAANQFVKRGVSINPTRFNVQWGGPFNATVTIHLDGSIIITHGGTEIGQGINTKVAQAVAYKFGLTREDVIKYIKIEPTNSTYAPGFGNQTGSSITSEMCVMAVMRACDTINDRLAPYRSHLNNWTIAVGLACLSGVELIATGYAATQSTTSGTARYNSWGCAVTEVEVDGLTGQFEIKRTDLLFDCGISMNPAVDIGQVEGGFMFGVGWFTSEIVQWDQATGEAVMAGSWRYKPPGAHDLPEVLNVTLLENSNNKVGVLGSKAVGEPPLALAISVVQALEDAINAVRAQGNLEPFTVTSLPITVDTIAAACAVGVSQFVLPPATSMAAPPQQHWL